MSDWNGISRDGKPLSMTAAQMAEWAMEHDQHISIMWGAQKEFSDKEVSDPLLKGARFVSLGNGEQTYEQAARRAGWPDLAEKFAAAGL